MTPKQKRTIEVVKNWIGECQTGSNVTCEIENLTKGNILVTVVKERRDVYDDMKMCILIIGKRGGMKQSKKRGYGLTAVRNVWGLTVN